MSWFYKGQRKKDWQTNLQQCVSTWMSKPFIWGETDCFCFAAACVEAQIGSNPMAGFIGSYNTKEEAYSLIKNGIEGNDGQLYKATSFEGYISLFLGESQPPLMAGRGDVVLINKDGMRVTSIVDDTGRNVWAMSESDGLVKLPLKMGKASWRL